MTDSHPLSFIRARGSTTSHRLVGGILLCGGPYPMGGTISSKPTGVECPWCRYAADALYAEVK